MQAITGGELQQLAVWVFGVSGRRCMGLQGVSGQNQIFEGSQLLDAKLACAGVIRVTLSMETSKPAAGSDDGGWYMSQVTLTSCFGSNAGSIAKVAALAQSGAFISEYNTQ